jgi:adenylate kinase family enzyme
MDKRVHFVGASGSGTTTLAAALAERVGCPHLDTDDYYWLPSDPPFVHVREEEPRTALLRADLEKPGGWALSGSLCGWGDVFIPMFDLVVFMFIPKDLRMARLRAREITRFGVENISPGASMYAGSQEFLEWAAGYDDGGLENRSLRRHNEWLATLPGPVLRLEGVATVEANLVRVLAALTS